MHLKNIPYAVLPVSDQDAALDFYTNVIGLDTRADVPTRDGPRFVVLGIGEQEFSVILWPGTPAEVHEGSGVCTFEVDDVQDAYDTLTARGVTFAPAGLIEYPWGWVARFRDPDGNLLQVRQGR